VQGASYVRRLDQGLQLSVTVSLCRTATNFLLGCHNIPHPLPWMRLLRNDASQASATSSSTSSLVATFFCSYLQSVSRGYRRVHIFCAHLLTVYSLDVWMTQPQKDKVIDKFPQRHRPVPTTVVLLSVVWKGILSLLPKVYIDLLQM